MSITKIKIFLLNLYPELRRFNVFKHLEAGILPYITPQRRLVLRISLPLFILVIILGLGLPLGLFILGLFSPRTITPPSVGVVTPSVTSTYQSQFIPIKTTIENFNPLLPDPAPPVIDNAISLELPAQ